MNKGHSMLTLVLNGLFLLVVAAGLLGIARSAVPGAAWYGGIWAAWSMANYLYIIRIRLCRNCSYYGLPCPLGWGRIVPLLCDRGDPHMFGRMRWPVVYLLSYAGIPPVFMTISLFFEPDPYVIGALIAFTFVGVLMCIAARKWCCTRCLMASHCLLSRIGRVVRHPFNITQYHT
ncbi:MAG: hypothetical protein ACMUIS_04560 [bacterium]